MRCPTCGSLIPDGSHLCPACGAATYEPGVPPWAYPSPAPPYARPGRPGLPEEARKGTIIGVLVVVAVVIVASIGVVLLIYAGDDDAGPVTLNFAAPTVVVRFDGTMSHRDATIEVNRVTPRDAHVMWRDVRVEVHDTQGGLLMNAVPVHPDDPSAYDDISDGTLDTEFWFVEAGGNSQVDAADAVRITAMPALYQGATVRIYERGELIGSVVLPTAFP